MSMFILGDEDTIIGFNLAGVDSDFAKTKEEALNKFNNLINRPDLKILIITLPISEWIENELIQHRLKMRFPLIVEVPDAKGALEYKESFIKVIRQAVGISI